MTTSNKDLISRTLSTGYGLSDPKFQDINPVDFVVFVGLKPDLWLYINFAPSASVLKQVLLIARGVSEYLDI